MTTPAQPPPAKGRKKSPAANPITWVIVLGVALAGGAYLLMRQRSTAANAAGTGTATPTGSLEDFAGQIATLQSEIADLQSSAAQDESGEGGTTTTPPPGGTTTTGLKAPAGFSITPIPGGADFGWSTVTGASAYELQVTGAGGKGTGTSHYDHAANATHARVNLAKGAYKARVRAGTTTANLTGPWTPYKSFTVTGKAAARPPAPKPKGAGSGTSGGSSGESEAA